MAFSVFLAALLVAGLSTGCAVLSGTNKCEDLMSSSPKVLTKPEDARVSSDAANTVLVVSAASDSPTRVLVTLDGAVALDAELPGGKGCAHDPIFFYPLELPAGTVAVAVTTGARRHRSVSMDVSRRKKYVTVMTQDRFPIYLEVTRRKPMIG